MSLSELDGAGLCLTPLILPVPLAEVGDTAENVPDLEKVDLRYAEGAIDVLSVVYLLSSFGRAITDSLIYDLLSALVLLTLSLIASLLGKSACGDSILVNLVPPFEVWWT